MHLHFEFLYLQILFFSFYFKPTRIKGLTTVLDSSLKDGKIGIDSASLAVAYLILSDVHVELDSATVSVADSLSNKLGIITDSTNEENLNFKLDFETFRNTRNLRQGLNKYANVLEAKSEKENDLKEQMKLREYIRS